MDEDNSLDPLTGEELVQLAMMAFIHMHDQDKIPKDQLLEDIMTWFRIMTAEIETIEVQHVMPLDEGVQH